MTKLVIYVTLTIVFNLVMLGANLYFGSFTLAAFSMLGLAFGLMGIVSLLNTNKER
jgi:hypothetical protein